MIAFQEEVKLNSSANAEQSEEQQWNKLISFRAKSNQP